jgi:undecaprenyl-diphosphatase
LSFILINIFGFKKKMEQTYLQAVCLGILQGITEFLPVSSSAHLILVSWWWDGKPLPMYLNVALHFGTLLAVLVYFAKDWLEMLTKTKRYFFYKEKSFAANTLFPSLVIASIPAGILGLSFKSSIEKYFHSPQTIVLPLFTVGILLWLVDKFCGTEKKLGSLTIASAFLIGIAQSFALIPGVSRSGATIIAARLLHFERSDAAKFSFLLGTPAMFGAALLHLGDFAQQVAEPKFYLSIIVSFLVGLATIKFFLEFIKKFGFLVFALYRGLLALVLFGIN